MLNLQKYKYLVVPYKILLKHITHTVAMDDIFLQKDVKGKRKGCKICWLLVGGAFKLEAQVHEGRNEGGLFLFFYFTLTEPTPAFSLVYLFRTGCKQQILTRISALSTI